MVAKSIIIVLKLYGTTVSHVSAMPHRHGMEVASKYFTSYNKIATQLGVTLFSYDLDTNILLYC